MDAAAPVAAAASSDAAMQAAHSLSLLAGLATGERTREVPADRGADDRSEEKKAAAAASGREPTVETNRGVPAAKDDGVDEAKAADASRKERLSAQTEGKLTSASAFAAATAATAAAALKGECVPAKDPNGAEPLTPAEAALRFPHNNNPGMLSAADLPVKALSFPAKLHAILSRDEFSAVVSWMPHGRAWKVHDPKAFEARVIPQFFVQCKYSSFIRQANGWGFRRVTKGRDRNSYYHEHFLRGRPRLAIRMRRPATSDKAPLDPRYVPDFYGMSEEDPLPEAGRHLDAPDYSDTRPWDQARMGDVRGGRRNSAEHDPAGQTNKGGTAFVVPKGADPCEQQAKRELKDAKSAPEPLLEQPAEAFREDPAPMDVEPAQQPKRSRAEVSREARGSSETVPVDDEDSPAQSRAVPAAAAARESTQQLRVAAEGAARGGRSPSAREAELLATAAAAEEEAALHRRAYEQSLLRAWTCEREIAKVTAAATAARRRQQTTAIEGGAGATGAGAGRALYDAHSAAQSSTARLRAIRASAAAAGGNSVSKVVGRTNGNVPTDAATGQGLMPHHVSSNFPGGGHLQRQQQSLGLGGAFPSLSATSMMGAHAPPNDDDAIPPRLRAAMLKHEKRAEQARLEQTEARRQAMVHRQLRACNNATGEVQLSTAEACLMLSPRGDEDNSMPSFDRMDAIRRKELLHQERLKDQILREKMLQERMMRQRSALREGMMRQRSALQREAMLAKQREAVFLREQVAIRERQELLLRQRRLKEQMRRQDAAAYSSVGDSDAGNSSSGLSQTSEFDDLGPVEVLGMREFLRSRRAGLDATRAGTMARSGGGTAAVPAVGSIRPAGQGSSAAGMAGHAALGVLPDEAKRRKFPFN